MRSKNASMRMLVPLLFLFSIAPPAFATKLISVDQLEQLLTAEHGKRDSQIADAHILNGYNATPSKTRRILNSLPMHLPPIPSPC
jgi:hypothetical protein